LYVCSPKFSEKRSGFLRVKNKVKKSYFFIVRLEIVCMFAAANKYSEKSSEIFGKGFRKLINSLRKIN
jgi:hypothetical protein